MQRDQPLAHLNEKELKKLGVSDCSMRLDKVEQISIHALLQNHHALILQGLVALSPNREMIILVPRDVPWHLHFRMLICVAEELYDVGMTFELLVHCDFAQKR